MSRDLPPSPKEKVNTFPFGEGGPLAVDEGKDLPLGEGGKKSALRNRFF